MSSKYILNKEIVTKFKLLTIKYQILKKFNYNKLLKSAKGLGPGAGPDDQPVPILV